MPQLKKTNTEMLLPTKNLIGQKLEKENKA